MANIYKDGEKILASEEMIYDKGTYPEVCFDRDNRSQATGLYYYGARYWPV